MSDTITHTPAHIFDRWASDPVFRVTHRFECLPSPSGHMHLVDPDPDAQYENYPVSLCGTALIAKGGRADDLSLCEACLDISKERIAEAGE